MRNSFDVEEDEPVVPKHDTELTLGPFVLLVMFFCLALVCGLFFGLGYAVGHRGAAWGKSTEVQLSAAAPSTFPAETTAAKPSANDQGNVGPSQTETATSAPNEVTSQYVNQIMNPETETDGAPGVNGTASQTGDSAAQNAQPRPTTVLMVQIATVSSQEDANVLVNALIKRGYAVTVNHSSSDNLFHVRVGPFFTHSEADVMCNQLLSEGYNAVVQP